MPHGSKFMSKCLTGARRLHQAHGEVRRRGALGPWRMLPWRARARPLGVRRLQAAAHLGVVCVEIFYPKYFYYITYSLSQRESSIVRSCPLLSATMLAHPPPVRNQKKDECRGDCGEKDIGEKLGSVRVVPIQRRQENHVASLQKLTFCPPAHPANAHRIIVNKIRN